MEPSSHFKMIVEGSHAYLNYSHQREECLLQCRVSLCGGRKKHSCEVGSPPTMTRSIMKGHLPINGIVRQGVLIWHVRTCQQSGKKIFLLMHGCALRMQGKLYLSLEFTRSTPPSQSRQKFSRNMEYTTPVKSLG